MKIILLISCVLFLGSNAFSSTSDATKEDVCVLMLAKGISQNSPARFDIQCGADYVVGHALPYYAQVADKEAFKSSLKDAVKQMMTGTVSCEDHESDVLWFSICKR